MYELSDFRTIEFEVTGSRIIVSNGEREFTLGIC